MSSFNHAVPPPSVSVTSLDENPIIGKPYSMVCNVIVAKGIVGNVNIMWKVNNTKLRNKIYPAWGNSSQYVDIYNISSVQFADNDATYSCEVVINGTHTIMTVNSTITIINIIDGKYI